jgi:hypothetical protein
MSQIKTISSSFSVNTLEDGKSAALLEFNKPLLMYTALNNGTSDGAQSFVVSFALKVDGNACTISSTDDIVIVSNPSQVVVNRSYITTSSIQVNIPNNKTAATLEGSIVVRVTGTYGGETYTSTAAITVSANRVGATGGRGKVGRFFYFAGTFNPQDNDPTHVFEVNDAQAPYFEHTENGQKRYHVFNYETNGSYTMAQMWAISSNWNNKPWESMTNDFKYLITEALFSNFAHLGGAIISGDWMISQHGTINGQASQDFQAFDSQHPNDDVETNFIPNYCVNLNTGDSYQHQGYFSGTIFAQSGVFSGFIRKKKVVITNSNYNEYARDIGQSTRLDFDKCGTFIELQMDEFPRYLDLPMLCWYYSPSSGRVTQEEADDIRSYVGTKCIIYNNSGTKYNIDLKMKYNGVLEKTYALYNGCCVSIECVLGYDEVESQGTTTRYENIYWIASDYPDIHKL